GLNVGQPLSHDATTADFLFWNSLELFFIPEVKPIHFTDYFTVTSCEDTSASSAYKSQTPRSEAFSLDTFTICSKSGRSFLCSSIWNGSFNSIASPFALYFPFFTIVCFSKLLSMKSARLRWIFQSFPSLIVTTTNDFCSRSK